MRTNSILAITASVFLASILIWSLAPSEASAGEPGQTGLLALRLGVGARAGAMGETGVAGARDGTAMYWNPANLGYTEGTQLAAQHTEHFGLFRKETVSVAHATEIGAFGAMVSGFYSDELLRTDEVNAGVVQGTFQPYDLVVGLAYAIEFSQLSLGITGKLLYERIDLYDGLGTAVDIGVVHKAEVQGLYLGGSIQNIGNTMKLNEEEFDLPLTLRVGGEFTPAVANGRLSLAAELVSPNDGNARLHAGAEVWLHETFALRGGNRFSYDTYGPTFGAGFRRNILSIDYAFMVNDNDFDNNHRISLNVGYLRNE